MMRKLILLFSGLMTVNIITTMAQPAAPDTGTAPAVQSLEPAETGTGSSNQLEYVPGSTPATPDAPTAAQPSPPPIPAAPVPAPPAPAVTQMPAVPETIPAPPERPAYIEIDLDRFRRDIDKPRRQLNGGGAGVLTPAMLVFDPAPIEKLAEKDVSLADKEFSFGTSPMMMWGGMGYGGTRNGIRFGGGGWAAFNGFTSQPYTTAEMDTTQTPHVAIDSLVELTVIPAFGGFLMEKHWQIKNLNLFVGGMMGGGALVVIKELKRANQTSAFWGDSHDDDADSDSSWSNPDNIDVAVAPMVVYGLHGGFTYTMVSWLHLGADAGAFMFHSHRGFGYGFGSIMTVNPAVRFRIVFGNLG